MIEIRRLKDKMELAYLRDEKEQLCEKQLRLWVKRPLQHQVYMTHKSAIPGVALLQLHRRIRPGCPCIDCEARLSPH